MRKWCKGGLIATAASSDAFAGARLGGIRNVSSCYEAARHDWERFQDPVACVQIRFSCSALSIRPTR
jgi:hypothetical protein